MHYIWRNRHWDILLLLLLLFAYILWPLKNISYQKYHKYIGLIDIGSFTTYIRYIFLKFYFPRESLSIFFSYILIPSFSSFHRIILPSLEIPRGRIDHLLRKNAHYRNRLHTYSLSRGRYTRTCFLCPTNRQFSKFTYYQMYGRNHNLHRCVVFSLTF